MYPRGPYWCGFPPPRHRGFAAPVGRGGWHFMHVVGLAAHGFAIPRTGVQLLGDLATAWAFAMATRRLNVRPQVTHCFIHASISRRRHTKRHMTLKIALAAAE